MAELDKMLKGLHRQNQIEKLGVMVKESERHVKPTAKRSQAKARRRQMTRSRKQRGEKSLSSIFF